MFHHKSDIYLFGQFMDQILYCDCRFYIFGKVASKICNQTNSVLTSNRIRPLVCRKQFRFVVVPSVNRGKSAVVVICLPGPECVLQSRAITLEIVHQDAHSGQL